MTHDLLRNLIVECGLSAKKVTITDLQENTFYAIIELTTAEGETMTLDSRPSDAIALALRLDCPIFVMQKVLDLSASSNQIEPESEDTATSSEDWPELIG